jgi:hypothetical protein
MGDCPLGRKCKTMKIETVMQELEALGMEPTKITLFSMLIYGKNLDNTRGYGLI